MDPNRLSQGQLVAALAAIALFIISFLPWFGFSADVAVQSVDLGGDQNFNLWQAENPFDVYLLIVSPGGSRTAGPHAHREAARLPLWRLWRLRCSPVSAPS